MPFTGSTTGSLRGGGSSIFSDVTGGTVVGAALGVDDPDPCCIATGLSRYRSHEGIRSQLRIITNYWNFTEGCALSEIIRIKSSHEKRTALEKATFEVAFLTAVAAVASLDPWGTNAQKHTREQTQSRTRSSAQRSLQLNSLSLEFSRLFSACVWFVQVPQRTVLATNREKFPTQDFQTQIFTTNPVWPR